MNAKTDHIEQNNIGMNYLRKVRHCEWFIGVSPIRNQVGNMQDGKKPDEFLRSKGWTYLLGYPTYALDIPVNRYRSDI